MTPVFKDDGNKFIEGWMTPVFKDDGNKFIEGLDDTSVQR